MKTVILAGGFGRRFGEERLLRPKALVEIGGKPLVVHVMDMYVEQGFTEFVLALGYRASAVKHYFVHFDDWRGDLTVRLDTGEVTVQASRPLPWTVHLIDTGMGTATAGRLKRIESWLGDEDRFFLTYCDGLADLDVRALLEFHCAHGGQVTVTGVRAPERFGVIGWNGDRVEEFQEKPGNAGAWVSGGFFVVEREVLSLIEDDSSSWETDVLPRLASAGELRGYRHEGFFAPVDTPEERDRLEGLCAGGAAPWSKRPA